jgi:hypothetical protein
VLRLNVRLEGRLGSRSMKTGREDLAERRLARALRLIRRNKGNL